MIWLLPALLLSLKWHQGFTNASDIDTIPSSRQWNAKWTKIVVLGDSTAGMLSDSLAALLSCTKITTEKDMSGRVPDKLYFSRNGKNYLYIYIVFVFESLLLLLRYSSYLMYL